MAKLVKLANVWLRVKKVSGMAQDKNKKMARRVQALLSGIALVLCTGLVHSRSPLPAEPIAVMSIAQLPPQGRETYRLIRQGGPFRYSKDGSVFGNRERILPQQQRGYYREYTVETSGLSHRGARRIVCGGAPRTPDGCYYTSDHYASFRKIVESKIVE